MASPAQNQFQADAETPNYSRPNIRQAHSVSIHESSSMNSTNSPEPGLQRSASMSVRNRASSVSTNLNARSGPSSPDDTTVAETPKSRKRLSINFALPVANSSPISGTTTTAGARIPRHATSMSVSLPASQGIGGSPSSDTPTNTTSPPSNSNHKHSASISSDSLQSVSGSTGPNTMSAIEYYFSQLAYKERRVIELREEIKRMEDQLRQAEEDFTQFRKQVPPELTNSMGGSANPSSNVINSSNLLSSSIGGNNLMNGVLGSPRPSLSTNTLSSPTSSGLSLGGLPLNSSIASPVPRPNSFLMNGPRPVLNQSSLERSPSVNDTLGPSIPLGGALPKPPTKNKRNSQGLDTFQTLPHGNRPVLGDDSLNGRKVSDGTSEIGNQFWNNMDNSDISMQTDDRRSSFMMPYQQQYPQQHQRRQSGLPDLSTLKIQQMQNQPPQSPGTGTQRTPVSGLPDLAVLKRQNSVTRGPTAPPRKPKRTSSNATNEIIAPGLGSSLGMGSPVPLVSNQNSNRSMGHRRHHSEIVKPLDSYNSPGNNRRFPPRKGSEAYQINQVGGQINNGRDYGNRSHDFV